MPDPRFFQTLQPLSVADIAARIGAEVERGGERTVRSVAPLSSADEGAIAFLGDRKFAKALAETRRKLAEEQAALARLQLRPRVLGEPAPLPCTPNGSIKLLERFGVDLNGAIVCVIGRGVTVGRPISLMLTSREVNATTVLCHTGTRDLAAE